MTDPDRIALFRYEVVAPLLDPALTPDERRAEILLGRMTPGQVSEILLGRMTPGQVSGVKFPGQVYRTRSAPAEAGLP